MNSCNFVGTLGRDWENKGKLHKNSLAVRKYDKTTLWVPLIAFGKTAEILEKHTTKGQCIGVSGELDINEYEGKYYTSVIVNKFSFTGGSKSEKDDF